MTNRLGLAIIPLVRVGPPATSVRLREAGNAAFDAIFTTEGNNAALATAQLIGSATRHIRVGTWTANIYLRHRYICAQGAALIAEATGGRFILGIGVSHQPVNNALRISMPQPADEHSPMLGTANRSAVRAVGQARLAAARLLKVNYCVHPCQLE